MTTENQIQVNLHKFKSKKQNLGAIEDAISEGRTNLEDDLSYLLNLSDDISEEYGTFVDALINFESAKELIVSYWSEYQSNVPPLVEKIQMQIDEFESNGIDVGNANAQLKDWSDKIYKYGSIIEQKVAPLNLNF